MKKHELLKYAYDNYQRGTNFIGAYGEKFKSSGSFRINHRGDVLNDPYGRVYSKKDDNWSEIVKDEPLKVDKIAVKVNNEREFKLLMQHYDSLGWLNCEGDTDDVEYFHKNKITEVTFHDKYSYLCEGSVYPSHTDLGYTVIDFGFWAAQNGVDVPKFMITSMDCVPLHKGDEYYVVTKVDPVKWGFATGDQRVSILTEKSAVITCPGTWLAFALKEVAEKWIEEHNKPKEIVLDYDTLKVVVTKMGFSAEATDSRRFVFSREDLENIYAAHKSLR